jgi:hypothetical protein
MEEQFKNKLESLQMWYEDFNDQLEDEDRDISNMATSLSLISRRALELQNLLLENVELQNNYLETKLN